MYIWRSLIKCILKYLVKKNLVKEIAAYSLKPNAHKHKSLIDDSKSIHIPDYGLIGRLLMLISLAVWVLNN